MGGKSKKYAIGLGRFTGYKSGMPYCSEARDIFRYMTDEPNSARKAALNRMVYGMIGDNLWVDDNDRLWMFAAHSGSGNTSLMDLLHPSIRGNDCTNVNSTTFNIDEGYTGNAINMYLNTNCNPSTDVINYALDDANIGFYVRNNIQENSLDIGCLDGNDRTHISVRYGTDTSYAGVNMATGLSVTQTDSSGLWIVSRIASNDVDLYRNATRIINGTTVSSVVPSKDIYVLARNDAGVAQGFAAKQVSMAFVGGGMIQEDVNNFNDWVNGYMTEIGKNVF